MQRFLMRVGFSSSYIYDFGKYIKQDLRGDSSYSNKIVYFRMVSCDN